MLVDPAAHTVATWLFVRAFGVVCVVAFVSLLVQMPGLFGSDGIRPIEQHLRDLRRGGLARAHAPSVFWWWASDAALWTVGITGLVASIGVAADIAPLLCLAVVYAAYLSFMSAGGEFLSYQWDALLLDTVPFAMLATAASPASPLARVAAPPPTLLLYALWFFAARFMLSSGLAKLRSRDRTWRDLTAVTYHHETQPLPTRLAWHAHQLPAWLHRATTLAVLVIEIGVPVLLFVPGPARLVGTGLLVLLQVAIVLSGSYGFFNLLTVVLLVPAVPDSIWTRVVGRLVETTASPVAPWLAWVISGIAVVLVALHGIRLIGAERTWPWARRVVKSLSPWRLVNRYGLFAVMTTERPELVIECSDDGETWQPVRCRWKPGDLAKPPRFVAPHQPRLDWQLWFAALGSAWSNPWLERVLDRLLEGSVPVTRLFAHVPGDGPPGHVRVVRYRYRFTDRATRRRTGRWWERGRPSVYLPAQSRDGTG